MEINIQEVLIILGNKEITIFKLTQQNAQLVETNKELQKEVNSYIARDTKKFSKEA